MSLAVDKLSGSLIAESLLNCNKAVIDQIYKECYPSIRHMVINNSGNIHDSEDIFHDALILLIDKARKNTLELTCSVKTYIYSVCFNMWQRQLRIKSKNIHLAEFKDFTDKSDVDQKVQFEQLYEIFLYNFNHLSPEYQKILNIYLSRYSMKKITREMGYANEKYAKVKKYLCKEYLKKSIHSDPRFLKLTEFYSN